jgi:peptidoglycan/LPS O-acetylase OafA/YrhL
MNHANKNIDSLDALRGYACVMAILGHLAKEEYILDIKGVGQLGVMMFFMLSGFLMAHLYTHKSISFPGLYNYFTRRLFRILPAYLVVVVASYYIYALYPEFVYTVDKAALIGLLTLDTQMSVFWTIPVEIKFYGFFPLAWLILTFAKSDRWKFVAMLLVFIALLKIDIPGTRLTLTKHIEYFIGGMTAAYMSYVIFPDKPWKRTLVNFFFVLSMGLILLLIPQAFLHVFGFEHHMWDSAFLIAPIFVVCVATCTHISGWVKTLFSNVVLRFIGTVSYSLYLVQYPSMRFVKTTAFFDPLPYFVQIVIAMLIALGITGILYLSIEAPFRDWGFKLSNKFSKKNPAG